MTGLYLGVDVGTGSARAGIFDSGGKTLGIGVQEIEIFRPQEDFVEQSSEDIWRAVSAAVKQALTEAGIGGERISGVGFDATCSLVALDADDAPVTVSPTERDNQNIIVWMDHRASSIAQEITSQGHEVLKYIGGVMSPEMETPKLAWLKRHLQSSWQRTKRFFDLPDFLVYRATGKDVRSLCSTVCKWTYLGHKAQSEKQTGFQDSYFRSIGLDDLVSEGYARIGTRVRPLGEVAGELTAAAASELGLRAGTPVGVSIIDAHAGGLGVLGTAIDGKAPTLEQLETRLALIGGTSSCHMAVSKDAKFINGVWGPYFSAMVPDMWLTEGGQSATGALIDHTIHSHCRYPDLAQEAETSASSVYDVLSQRLDALGQSCDFPARLTEHLHVLPYYHGNRSPRADASLRGMVSGLKLTDDVDSLAVLYLATIQAIAHGTRHIIDTLNDAGYSIDTILACGGGTKNEVFLREHADVSGCRIVLPREPEAVLLGSAIIGAAASGDFPSLFAAMHDMNQPGRVIAPSAGDVADYHKRKHRVFQRMYDDQMKYRQLMRE